MQIGGINHSMPVSEVSKVAKVADNVLPNEKKVETGSDAVVDTLQIDGHTVNYAQNNENEEFLNNAIEEANQKLRMNNRYCEITYHKEAKRISIKVIDSDTKEIVREIPSESVIRMAEKLRELTGLLVDEKC